MPLCHDRVAGRVDQRVLAGRVELGGHDLAGVLQCVDRRAVHLGKRPVAVGVLHPGRRRATPRPAGPASGRPPAAARPGGPLHRRGVGLQRAAHREQRQRRDHHRGPVSPLRSWQASAASPMVAALLLMKPSASAGCKRETRRRPGAGAPGPLADQAQPGRGERGQVPGADRPVQRHRRGEAPVERVRQDVQHRGVHPGATRADLVQPGHQHGPAQFGGLQGPRSRPRGCAAAAARARPGHPRPAPRSGSRRPRWSGRIPAAGRSPPARSPTRPGPPRPPPARP